MTPFETDSDGHTIVKSRFWVLMTPDKNGSVVAKFDAPGTHRFPDEIANSSDFVAVSVSSRSNLEKKTIDQSGLTDAEKQMLKSHGIPIV